MLSILYILCFFFFFSKSLYIYSYLNTLTRICTVDLARVLRRWKDASNRIASNVLIGGHEFQRAVLRVSLSQVLYCFKFYKLISILQITIN